MPARTESNQQQQDLTLLSAKIKQQSPDTNFKESDIESLYKYIVAKDGGEELLTTVLTKPALVQELTVKPRTVNLAGFQSSTAANGSIIAILFYARVQVKAPDLRRAATANLGGIIPGIPGGALFGTLYYDNSGDLTGDFDCELNCVYQFINVNFFKGGSCYASFVAGNVGSLIGISGGSGSWGSA